MEREAKWGWGQHPACPRLSRADLEADAEDWAQVGCGTGVERGLAVGRGRGTLLLEGGVSGVTDGAIRPW